MADTYSGMAKKVRRLRRNLDREHDQATAKGMRIVKSEMQGALRANDSIARRVLINDILYADNPTDATSISKRVHLPDWAKYLEHGTGIHSTEGYKAPRGPPTDAITTWAVAKNITPREYDTVYGLAGAIAEQIADEGNQAHPFISPVWHGPYGYQNIINENKRAQRRALRRTF